jgi:hypothetical protein
MKDGLAVGIWVAAGRGDRVADIVRRASGIARRVSVGRGVNVAGIGLVNVTDTASVVSSVGVTAEIVSVLWIMTVPTGDTGNGSFWQAAFTAATKKKRTRIGTDSCRFCFIVIVLSDNPIFRSKC